MKRLLMLISLVFLCCFTVGCISRDEAATADVEADIQAIKDNVVGFFVSSNASEIDRVMSYFAETAIAIPPNEPAAIGKDTIPLCANNAETPYPCYISVEGRDEKEDGKKSNGYGGSRGGDPDDEWRRA
jgi:hypothetical protein